MNRLYTALVLLVVAATAIGGCALKPRATEIVVTVRVELCPLQSSDCYRLLLPSADVLLRGDLDFAKEGITDEHGQARFTLPQAGTYQVRVDSFALSDRLVEATVQVRKGQSAATDLTGKAAAPR